MAMAMVTAMATAAIGTEKNNNAAAEHQSFPQQRFFCLCGYSTGTQNFSTTKS